MHVRKLATGLVTGMMLMTGHSQASPLDELRWKNRVIVVVAPAGNAAVEQQRQIYQAAAAGMSERGIVLREAVGDSDRARQIRSRLSADGKRFQVFLIGKDGHTALSSDKPLSAEVLFAKVDAMPMRRDEMRRTR
ncbi:DUF4174 domain-containing protein [Rhodopseudomonas sp. HC1]|uniref:DUF4174 domain-containing protein n=1 Tax=Rhodopseudomonas infernalis TaxID=2897386 RepID=UPI001EE7E80B|nr:DUF4174 domain-containing protein [Rhodopseudomonas infernalis]MCG6205972.1 DUF4174 domain-containing protein [Rhodopseudomonas infernalis]